MPCVVRINDDDKHSSNETLQPGEKRCMALYHYLKTDKVAMLGGKAGEGEQVRVVWIQHCNAGLSANNSTANRNGREATVAFVAQADIETHTEQR